MTRSLAVMTRIILCSLFLFILLQDAARAQWAPSTIRLNRQGFYQMAPKFAVVIGSPATIFYILRTVSGDTVFTGILGPQRSSANSTIRTQVADFTVLRKEGIFVVAVPGMDHSGPFRIGAHVAEPIARAALKGYYYQRSAMTLDPRYAGQWSRPAGHPDSAVLIHPSAASQTRPAGTVISSIGGWYDAGDYNKYIVNSGITMGTLLSAYEDFPRFLDTLHTNIPSLPIPDILNEALYNLRWMLTMQDPNDGGVYHKCTNAAFDSMVMPGVTKAPRYVVQKGTAATLDFAAVMAQAGRIMKRFTRQLPGLADSCMHAAVTAWQWAVMNPDLVYDQDAMNTKYQPKVVTGAYGDRNFKDEWFWAAAELLVSTGDPSGVYGKMIGDRNNDPLSLPSWSNVHMLGLYTLLRNQTALPAPVKAWIPRMKQGLLALADDYCRRPAVNAFHTVMGGSRSDFIWGSNAVAANQGILLINAWLLSKDKKYIDPALDNLDYLMGRNATGYCFITGMGSNAPMHPHHRPSVADGVLAPVPGLLVGGPNPGRQDHMHYENIEPETAYTDQAGAYASNEIAINWNAPLVYLATALSAILQ